MGNVTTDTWRGRNLLTKSMLYIQASFFYLSKWTEKDSTYSIILVLFPQFWNPCELRITFHSLSFLLIPCLCFLWYGLQGPFIISKQYGTPHHSTAVFAAVTAPLATTRSLFLSLNIQHEHSPYLLISYILTLHWVYCVFSTFVRNIYVRWYRSIKIYKTYTGCIDSNPVCNPQWNKAVSQNSAI